MAQNQAHMGDIVSPIAGDLKGQEGYIVALRINDNRCMVRIVQKDNPTNASDYQYDGTELKLIDCYHMGITTSE